MAYELPPLERFLPRLALPPVAPAPREPMGPPEATYDDLTPSQKVWVDKQQELQRTPRSAVGEIATGAWRGLVSTLPKMVGQALQSTGRPGLTPNSGGFLYDTGTKIVNSAKMRDATNAADENPDAHNAVTNAFAQGAEMIAPSLAAFAPLAVASPALAALGLPAIGAAASAAIGGGTSAAIYAGSTFQDTWERGKAAGLSDEDARTAALKSAAIEGLGEAVATPVLGRALGMFGKAVPRVLGKKYGTEEALAVVRDPKLLPAFAREMGKVGAVEVGTEMGQSYGEAAVEKNAGISDVSPWDAATGAIGPTLAMTALLGPFAALGMRSRLNRNKKLIDTIEGDKTSFQQTDMAMRELAPQLEPLMGKAETAQWRSDVLVRANQIEAGTAQMNNEQQDAMYREAVDSGIGPPTGPFPNPNPPEPPPTPPGVPPTTPPAGPAVVVPPAPATVVAPQTLLPAPVLSTMRASVLQEQKVDNPQKGWLAKNDKLLAAAASEPTWEAQVDYLRKARDSMAPKGAAKPSMQFEMMDSLIKKVEAYHGSESKPVQQEGTGQGDAEAQVGQPVQQRESQSVREDAPSGQGEGAVEIGGKQQARNAVATAAKAAKVTPEAFVAAAEAKHAAKQELTREEGLSIALKKNDEFDAKQAQDRATDYAAAEKRGVTQVKVGDVVDLTDVAKNDPRVQESLGGKSMVVDTVEKDKDGKITSVQGRNADSKDGGIKLQVTDLRTINAAPASEAEPTPPPVPAEGVGAAPVVKETKQEIAKKARATKTGKVVVISATGKSSEVDTHTRVLNPVARQADGTVPWGAGPTTIPLGDVSYDTKPSTTPPQTAQDRFKEAKMAKAKENLAILRTQVDIPEPLQRTVSYNSKYAFEMLNYNSNAPRGMSTNVQWIADYQLALEDSKQTTPAGKPTAAALNAQKALLWLDEYEGADIKERAVNRSLAGWEKLSDDAKPLIKRELDRIAKTINRDVQQAFMEQHRFNLAAGMDAHDARNIMQDAMDEVLADEAANDAGLQYVITALNDYTEKSEFENVAKNAGNLNSLLTSVEELSSSDWVQYTARWLRGLNLDVRVQHYDQDAADPETGHRVGGRYIHDKNLIAIFRKGASAHTILHEGAHAATVGELIRGIEALGKPAAQLTAADKSAMHSVLELREVMAQLKALDTKKQYAFKNEAEFVAEALSSRKFQTWLKAHQYFDSGLSRWTKFLNVIRDFFGWDRVGGIDAFDKVMSIVPDFATGSRFGEGQGFSFDHSATEAAGQTDLVVSTLVQKALAFAKAKLPDGLMNQAWHFSTTFNISEMVERMPTLRALKAGLRGVTETDELRVIMRMEKQKESSIVTKPVQLALSKIKDAKKRKAMNQLMQEYAGTMSQLGVDLNKNYEQNLKDNPDLDPAQRDYINAQHAAYRQLPAQFKKPLEESFRVLRKGYIQQSMNVLRNVLQSYAKDSPEVEKYLKLLDIRNGALFDAMPNPRPDYYLDSYSARADATMRTVLAEAIALQTAKGNLQADLHDINKFYTAAVGNPYIHLGRSGEYFLEFNANPNVESWNALRAAFQPFGKVLGPITAKGKVFMRFENAEERDGARAVVDKMQQHVDVNTIKNGSLFDESSMQNMQGVQSYVRRLMKKIDVDFAGEGADKAAMRAYLKRDLASMLSDSAPQKALMQRAGGGGVAGYDADFLRSFTKRTEGAASMLSNSYTMPLYDAAFQKMRDVTDAMKSGDAKAHDQAVRIVTEIGKRFGNSLTPVESPLIDGFKAFGFNYFLAFSPAFWLTNMVQPYHLTLPYIGGRHGFIATAKEMGRSTKKAAQLMQAAIKAGWGQGKELGGLRGAVKGILDLDLPLDQTGLSPGEMNFVRGLILSGQLDTTQGHEQGRLASGDSATLTSTMKLLSVGSHYTEVLNRLTAGLTAYNMSLKNADSKASEVRKELTALNYGIQTVRETQFDYSDHNTARALGRHGIAGKVTPLIASFQQYAFQTSELLVRMAMDSVMPIPKDATKEEIDAINVDRKAARRGLAGVMTVTSFLAGSLGLPMANAIAAVVDRLIGSDDDPYDVKSAWREWLAGIFGKDVAEAVARGVPRAVLGFDTSNRMGMQDLIPGTKFLSDRRALKDKVESGAFNMLGPAVSAGTAVLVGMGKILDGQIMDGLLEMAPLALKGPIKAVKVGEEGYTTNTGNLLPIEPTPWGALVQTLGFTPSAKAEHSEVNFAFRQRDMQIKQRKTILSNKVYNALEEKKDATALMEEVMLFNQANPQHKIDVGSGLASRAKARAVAGITDSDIATLPRYLPQLSRYDYANVK